MNGTENTWLLIAGLGNPGRQYEGTRHNVGFAVIDELVDTLHFGGPERFGKAYIGKGRIGAQKVILMKPLTYMNLSGEAIRQVADYYRIEPKTGLLVINDDIDLPTGRLRLRMKGSAGSHNGLKNIVKMLGTSDFARIRVGVGSKPDPDYDLADYVLGHFSKEEKEIMDIAVKQAAEAAVCWAENGIDIAMNVFNKPAPR